MRGVAGVQRRQTVHQRDSDGVSVLDKCVTAAPTGTSHTTLGVWSRGGGVGKAALRAWFAWIRRDSETGDESSAQSRDSCVRGVAYTVEGAVDRAWGNKVPNEGHDGAGEHMAVQVQG